MKLAFSIAAIAAVCASNAAALFDNTATNINFTIRDSDTPALHISNSNASDLVVTNAAFYGMLDSGTTQDFDYFLADGNGNILNEVHKSLTDSGLGLYGADVNWTLKAGESYFIGAAFDGRNNQFGYGLDFTPQNGLVPDVNGNFVCNGLGFEGTAGANMTWVLNGNPAVPEPASMAALGLGVAALIRRRRASK